MKSLIIDTHEALTKIYPLKYFVRDCVKDNITTTIEEASNTLVKRISEEKNIPHTFKSFKLNKRGAEYTIQFLQDLDIINKNNLLTSKGIVFKHFTESSSDKIYFDKKEKYVFFKYLLNRNFAYIFACMKYIDENKPFNLDTDFLRSQESMKIIESAAKIALKLSENKNERNHAIRILNFLQKNKILDTNTKTFYYGYSYKTRVHKVLPIFSLLSEIGIISSYKEENKVINSNYTDIFFDCFPTEKEFKIAYDRKIIDKHITLILNSEKEEIDENALWDQIINTFNLIKNPQRNTCYLEALVDISIVNILFETDEKYSVTAKKIYDYLWEKNRKDNRIQVLPDRWGRPTYFHYKSR